MKTTCRLGFCLVYTFNDLYYYTCAAGAKSNQILGFHPIGQDFSGIQFKILPKSQGLQNPRISAGFENVHRSLSGDFVAFTIGKLLCFWNRTAGVKYRNTSRIVVMDILGAIVITITRRRHGRGGSR